MPFLLTADDLRPDPRPHLWVVGTYRRDQIFGPHIGEVIARGVKRSPSGDYRTGSAVAPIGTSHLSWPVLQMYVGGPRYRADLELTRAKVEKRQRRGRLRRR
jgi:hypothetical protein